MTGIDKLPKPSACDDYCKGCRHYNESYGASCEYMRDTGMRRPCPAGTGCTEHTKRQARTVEGFVPYVPKQKKKTGPPKGTPPGNKLIDDAKGRELFEAGKTDAEIAAVFHCAEGTVRMWRKRMRLLRKRGGTRKRKTEDLI